MTGAKFAKLLDAQERAEAKLLRAFTKWAKLRAQVKRAEKALDKAPEAGAAELPGEADIIKLATAAGIKPRPWPKGKGKLKTADELV